MSEENEQGEEKPKDDLAGSDEFEFYFSFTKPLVLDLPSSEDRAIAAAWVQKLEAEPESEEEKQLRLNYLKLLLFVLQRGRLSGIFKKQPPSGPLQPFPQGFSLTDMGNWMLDQDDGQPCGGGDARSSPYTIEISNDLREFIASQEIPNFGIQMYYAWSSDDPIHKWTSFDEEKFPQFILDKIKQLKETKSDDRSSIVKGGCLVKKKGCEITLPDKYSKKKVKSPQEIERSQGRSFHTYMGLVGRMGNFNDKCDDDPDKFQRQEQRKVKCPKRGPQKRCPGNGGEDDMMPEEDYDNLVSGLGGLKVQPKSCLCNNQRESCPDDNPKGRPQAFEPQQSAGRNGFGTRGDMDPNNCPPVSPRRQLQDLCPDFSMPQMGPQQRNNGCRSRSGSPSRPQECPPEEKAGGFPEPGGVCICSKPPCTCPCPRDATSKATSNANSARTGGRPPPETNRCPTKPAKQDLCGPEGYGNRGAPNFGGPNRAPDNCPPMGPPNGGVGNRQGPSMRPGQTEVVHCYDARNPDPALYDKLDKGWMDAAQECGNKRLEADFQNFMAREQPPGQNMQAPRRGFFGPPGQSNPIAQDNCGVPPEAPKGGRFCPPNIRVTSPTPPRQQQGACDCPVQDDSNAGYPAGNQQMNFGNRPGFLECEAEAMPRTAPNDCFGQRQKQDPCRKSPSQAMSNPRAYAGAQGGNENCRMANMANALQGMKQRTEAHREKCDAGATRRSPSNDATYCTGNVQAQAKSNRETCKPRSPMAFDNAGMAQGGPCRNARQGQQMYAQQAKQAQQCGPSQEGGFVNLSNPPQTKQCMPQKRPVYSNGFDYPNNQTCPQGFDSQDIWEVDLAAYDSLEACRQPSPVAAQNMNRGMPQGMPQRMQQSMPQGMQQCMPQGMPQDMQQCMPQGMQQGMPQGMQQCMPQGMPQGMQQCMPQGMQQSMPQGAQLSTPMVTLLDCNSAATDRSGNAPPFAASGTTETEECNTPQWVSPRPAARTFPSQRPGQGELGDVEGRCIRPTRGQPQSSGPSTSCAPTRSSPSRTTAGRTSPPRNGFRRNSPGTTTAQDPSSSSPSDSCSAWSNVAQCSGSRTPDFSSLAWQSPPQCRTNNYSRLPSPEPRFQDVQSAPCPPNPCPAPNMSFPRQNAPCAPQQRSVPNYSNCPQQAMNAELQFQEDQCVDDMAEDMGNMDMNNMECADEQNYALQDGMCEDDGEAAYDEEDNQECDAQNFMAMNSGPDGGEECYDDYQDMNDCDPMPPPQNPPMSRCGGGGRNNGNQGQLGCNRPPPMNNRNPNPPDQCSGGITTIHRR